MAKLFGWMLNRLYKELQSFGNTFTLIFIRTLAERKWRRHVVVSLSPGENGREHFEVFHKCTLFFLVLPYCSTSLSYDYYISRVSSPPSHQLFFHGVTAGESRVRRGTIGPLGVPPGNWTAGSSCLKEDWRWYLGGGP